MLELNNIYNCDCRDGLKQLEDNVVDLTVTSPPYDSLRTYQDDAFAWNFDIFKEVANELYRVTKPGGVVVWVVGDEVVNGGETGTSFRQALYFQEIGFKIHDTMIYEKNSSTFPAKANSKRYSQIFEYMFVFTKGKIRGDIKLIADKRNKWAGWTNWGTKTQYDKEGNLVQSKKNIKPTPEFSLRTNIWKYTVSFNDKTGHPAVFPEKLAEDHILSWTNEGDVVLDPFMGSGTTAKMAMLNKRNYIGFEKNEDYWAVSLKRVGKYDGQTNEALEIAAVNDTEGNSDELQIREMDDKEFNEKNEFCQSLVNQLKDYAETMSIGILKTLKLTFATKANDRRVENVLKERGLYTGTTEDVADYCMGQKQEELGDVRGKRYYETPRVVSITDVPKGDFISDLTLPGGGYYIPELTRKYNAEKHGITISNDNFMKDVETIMPDGVKFKGDEQKYFSTDDVEFLRSLVQREIDRLITGKEVISKIKKELKKDERTFVTNDSNFGRKGNYEEKGSVTTDVSEPEIVVPEPPIEDCGITVIDMQTMDPVQILPDSLNEAVKSGKADELVEVQPMGAYKCKGIHPIELEPSEIFESIPPKRKRGRPKGSKNKPKTF